MRSIIIGLSVIFFTLSVIITFKALGLPVYKTSYQDDWKDVATESNDVIKEFAEDQDDSRILVTDLQEAIDQLEGKLAEDQDASRTLVTNLQEAIDQLEDKLAITIKEETSENIKTIVIEDKPRVLKVFGSGTFRSGWDIIDDVDLSTIENLVGEILASPSSRVIIEGHTDNIPTGKLSKSNMDLSLLRAKAIANILITHGVSSDQISEIGYGDTRPIGSNDTEEGRAENRRVEVKLMPEEGEN